MINLLARSPRICIAPAVVAAILLLTLHAPPAAVAHWGACANDPKVWLSDGAQVQMGTLVQADRSLVTQVSFTVSVPAGVTAARIVRTKGADPSSEPVTLVADSAGGYRITAHVTTLDGGTYPVDLAVHVVNQSSNWYSTSGSTGQDIFIQTA